MERRILLGMINLFGGGPKSTDRVSGCRGKADSLLLLPLQPHGPPRLNNRPDSLEQTQVYLKHTLPLLLSYILQKLEPL